MSSFAEAIELIGADDDVDETGFVFEGEEEEALGRARTLAADHGARHPDEVAVAAAGEVDRAQDVGLLQLVAETGDGMGANGEVGAHDVGAEAVEGGHGGQGESGGSSCGVVRWGLRVQAGAFD